MAAMTIMIVVISVSVSYLKQRKFQTGQIYEVSPRTYHIMIIAICVS